MPGATRSFIDLLSFLGGRRSAEPDAAGLPDTSAQDDSLHPTKAIPKFLKSLQNRERSALIDLGPVVGSNVTFFGEHLGCRIRVEDIASDIERHHKAQTLDQLPAFFEGRFPQEAGSVDGILCWDVFDYLDRPAARALGAALSRLLRPDGVLLGLFSTAAPGAYLYTKYIIVDDQSLRYRTYPASRPRQHSLVNRDIIKLFNGLEVTDSFLMKNNVREMLFRKPAEAAHAE